MQKCYSTLNLQFSPLVFPIQFPLLPLFLSNFCSALPFFIHHGLDQDKPFEQINSKIKKHGPQSVFSICTIALTNGSSQGGMKKTSTI